MKNYNKIKLNLFTFAGTDVTSNVQTSTDSDIAKEFKVYYDKRLIKKTGPNLVFAQFAVKKPLTQGSGKTIEFRGIDEMSTEVNARKLAEGVTPAAQQLKMYTIEATVAQYGGWVGLTDMVIATAIDPMVTAAVDALSAQAEIVLDKIIRNAIVGDDEVAEAYAGSAAAENNMTPANNKITVADIRRIVNMLKRANAPKIDGAYPLILHTDVASDLQGDAEYKELYHYLKPANLAAGYVGDVAGARIYESTNVLITKNATSNKAIYHNVLIGQGAYGTTDLEGGGLKTIIKQLGSSGSSDPCNQRGSIAWVATTVAKVIVPKYLVNYSCCATYDGVADAETEVTA